MCIAANEVAPLSPDNEDKMNLYKSSNRFCVLLAGCCLLLANDSYAIDFEGLQNQCAELGFKIKTPENGKCVLKLRKKVIGLSSNSISNSAPVISQSIEAANQRNYERQQRYAKDAEIDQKNREIEALRQQQVIQQQQAIQQQQLAIQQQQAMQQRQQEPSGGSFLLQLLGAAAVGYNESRHPPTVHCTSSKFGNSVDTTCR